MKSASWLTPRRAVVVLLVFIGLFILGLEVVTRLFIARVSNTEARFAREYAAALRARQDTPKPSVVLVGNSLLFEDVDADVLRKTLVSDVDAYPVPVLETTYYDWYYGVKRLFARGSRPNMVALVMARWHLTSDFFRGPYSAHRLLGSSDVLALSRDLHLHPTVTSSYLIANASAFYGLRTEIRGTLLKVIVPGVSTLAPVFGGFAEFSVARAKSEANPDAYSIALSRLRQLKELANAQGIRFLLVLPPTPPDAELGEGDPVLRAARDANIEVFETSSPDQYPLGAFRDNIHMNTEGAARYTLELAAALRRLLHDESP